MGDRLAICAHVFILCSQKGVSRSRIRFTLVYDCLGVGQPSSSAVMRIEEVREKEISFPDHFSGPPRGWRSAMRRVAILRAITDGQRDLPPQCEWKASSNGQCWNLLAACANEALVVAPRAPWSFIMLVQEFVAAEQ